jgi:uncharacterized protein (TIGR03546 family)
MAQSNLKIWQRFLGTVSGMDSAGQLAAGVALGMIIGLLPMDSLLPYLFLLALLFTRANLLTAISAAAVFSWIGIALTSIEHSIGRAILTFEPLEPAWTWMIQQPIIPWTRFENTVVTGSLILGLLACYPVYRLSKFGFTSYGSILTRWAGNSTLMRSLSGTMQPNFGEVDA